MARKIQNRMEMRKQAEAAEAMDGEGEEDLDAMGDDAEEESELDAEIDLDMDDDSDSAPRRKKKPVKKKAAARPKRSKAKAVVRKRLLWGVFSASMKEEGRFGYAELDKAEERAEALRQKNKREYFVQRIKEPIADAPPPEAAAAK